MSETIVTEVDPLTEAIAAHRECRGPLLPLLHAVQARCGHIGDDAVARIAEALNLSRAEVHGVVSFYGHFRRSPGGRHRVGICRAEACQAVGSRALAAEARQQLGIDFGATSADGAFSLQGMYCLGNCAAGPSVLIDDELYGRVDAARLAELLAEWRARE
ncbi:MAG: formate dehydrogenase subunit gamma [Pseudomonadales bacterium]|jgi:formate dehydrogenase subunit gamma|nr:formate dehydrogenase subunit gamma [Pseudomonadales bacterium]MCP5320270.1 formate dehydrogenase subunit gamma [Pseudomonadales bacterium]MCP5337817.1 formate dehydrogenase subunit gamma [Pseudomonadales bacterium]